MGEGQGGDGRRWLGRRSGNRESSAEVQRPTESGHRDGYGSDKRAYPGNSVQSKPAVEDNSSEVSAPSAAYIERSNIKGRGKVRSTFALIHDTQLQSGNDSERGCTEKEHRQ